MLPHLSDLLLVNALSLPLACILDYCLGDPNVGHPIVLFGRTISWGEKRLNRGRRRREKGMFYNGCLMLLAFALPLCLLSIVLIGAEASFGYLTTLSIYCALNTIGVFYMLSGTTLISEARQVFVALGMSLEQGRQQVARIVGRDTSQLSSEEIKVATLETLSENLSDGVVAPMLWYATLGLPGMMLYKMVNTQDSMIGYKTSRYKAYGWFSAKVDDVANYIPARLTSLLMLLVSGKLSLIPFVLSHGKRHSSPNSGYPEAALAGILQCRFGGSHYYFGQEVYKPYIGNQQRELSIQDLHQAVNINRRVEWTMLGLICLTYISISLFQLQT